MTVNIGLGRSYGRGPEEKRPTKNHEALPR